MYNFTIQLFGDTQETIHTDDYMEAMSILRNGQESYDRGYVVDNLSAEIFADFGYED